MDLSNNKKIFFVLFPLLIITSIIILFYPFLLSHFNITASDSAGLFCGAKNLIIDKEFSHTNIDQLAFSACWTKDTYPGYQLLIALLAWPWKNYNSSIGLAIIFTAIIICLICSILIYKISYQIWQNKLISTISFIAAITSLPLSIALTLTPHNLFGYLGILIGLNELVKYIKFRKIKYLVYAIIITLPLYFFHQLSLFVYLICLMLFFVFSETKKILKIYGIALAVIGIWLISYFYFHQLNPINALNAFQAKDTDILQIHNFFDHPATLGYFLVIFGISGLILFAREKNNKTLTKLFIILIVGPLIFTVLPYFGWQVVPFRFILFLWIPLSILCGFGFFKFSNYIRLYLPKVSFLFLIYIFILTNVCHYLIFTYHNFRIYTVPYLLTSEEKNAYRYLQANTDSQANILAIYYDYRHPAIMLPSYINNNIYRYTPSLKTSDLYQEYFINKKKFFTLFYRDLEAINNKDAMQKFINQYNISQIIIWPDKIDSKIIYNFDSLEKKVYQSTNIIIYAASTK